MRTRVGAHSERVTDGIGPSHRLPLEGIAMLWTIFVVLVVLWLLGFGLNVGGVLIHALLVIALIVLVFNLVTRLRSA